MLGVLDLHAPRAQRARARPALLPARPPRRARLPPRPPHTPPAPPPRPQVCHEGQALDPNQAALLRVFEIKMATFRFTLLAAWADDEAEELAGGDEDGSGDGEDGSDDGGVIDGGAFGGFPEEDAAMMLPAGV